MPSKVAHDTNIPTFIALNNATFVATPWYKGVTMYTRSSCLKSNNDQNSIETNPFKWFKMAGLGNPK